MSMDIELATKRLHKLAYSSREAPQACYSYRASISTTAAMFYQTKHNVTPILAFIVTIIVLCRIYRSL